VSTRTQLAGALLCALLFLPATPAEAIFRFDEIEPRTYDFNDEYFINIFNYRRRIEHRWHRRDAALVYSVTSGSLRTDELYVDQRATIRLPWGDNVSTHYRFVEWEDYDARYQRNELELLTRFFRPVGLEPLGNSRGRTPRADGLFFGGLGVLDADKEFADLGLAAGYRNETWGVRLDAWAPDFFFDGKNKERGEFTSAPYTFELRTWLDLLKGDLKLSAWFQNDLPLRVVLPERQEGLVFRYRQLRTGLDAAWKYSEDVRFDFELWAERTRKRRRAYDDPDPFGTDKVNREALKIFAQSEFDVEPLWGDGASRDADVVMFGAHVHLLNEITRHPLLTDQTETIRRQESYLEIGYVLALPSFDDHVGFGFRASLIGGMLSWRDVRPRLFKHRVTEKLLAKLSLGLEVDAFDDLGLGFFQLTFRLDDQTFGGFNVHVMMRF
jgi:hypothetical protein